MPAAAHVCPKCLALGNDWVHLRVCQQCGHVGCCDFFENKYVTKYYRASPHPVVSSSAAPGERWLWCYLDEEMAGY